ncbi:MAG TPA: carboxypeptidase-like regulatory domain-containing protein, partial [Acetobacteraceae bacterium]|nr:carboxypeptidase-like regulatory domain-containing protein [Acetobacteraceae bacterium]
MILLSNAILRQLALAVVVLTTPELTLAQAPSGVIEGQITDASGAAIPGAAVIITGSSGSTRTSAADKEGRYRIDGLPPASYTVRIQSPGFALFTSAAIGVGSQVQTVNARLDIQTARANVTVADSASQVGVDPSQNLGQIVLRGDDLDAFADDPEDLTNELQMLAGPAVGPNAGQIFVDGFTGGIMPPKASIREIRVNQNPFAAEYDRVGFGRVEVFTKPGSDMYHGQASFDFGNRALTARNPYLTGPIVPNYRQEIFAGNFAGP